MSCPCWSLRALCAQGHEVAWYTGAKYRTRVESTGARFYPYCQARDFDDARLEEVFPERARLAGLHQLKFDMMHVFADAAEAQLSDLRALCAAEAPKVVVADALLLGALLLRELEGIPLLLVNVVANPLPSPELSPFGLGLPPCRAWYGRWRDRALHALVRHALFADVRAHWQRVQRRAGVSQPSELFDAPLRASIFALPTVPSFEYPRSDLPANVRFVGALHAPLPESHAGCELWRELAATRPIVHVTQGTLANARPSLIAPALAALSGENVVVVVATGGPSAAQLGLTPVPSNARIVPFVAYPELLPHVSAMVTNGGYGGVQLALSFGVPLVVWGTTEDKPETAARVAWSGAGVRLRGARPTRRGLRNAVRRVLTEPSYKRRAMALAAEFASMDAVCELSRLVLELAQGRMG